MRFGEQVFYELGVETLSDQTLLIVPGRQKITISDLAIKKEDYFSDRFIH